jgi:hypothetical protein
MVVGYLVHVSGEVLKNAKLDRGVRLRWCLANIDPRPPIDSVGADREPHT